MFESCSVSSLYTLIGPLHYIFMRASFLSSFLLSSVIASAPLNELALRGFIIYITKYPLDSIPTTLSRGVAAHKKELRQWAALSEPDFIESARDEIRTIHGVMMRQQTMRDLFTPTLREMTERFEDEDERIAEFAKIYRDALRNMEDFKRK